MSTFADPADWPVSAIMDHSGDFFSAADGLVRPFTSDLACLTDDGSTALCDGESDLGANSLPSGYRLDCVGTTVDFGSRMNYVGSAGGAGGNCPEGGDLGPLSYLDYNGHPGYDFDTSNTAPFEAVLAAAAGDLAFPEVDPCEWEPRWIQHS